MNDQREPLSCYAYSRKVMDIITACLKEDQVMNRNLKCPYCGGGVEFIDHDIDDSEGSDEDDPCEQRQDIYDCFGTCKRQLFYPCEWNEDGRKIMNGENPE